MAVRNDDAIQSLVRLLCISGANTMWKKNLQRHAMCSQRT
jgi:hypothetical protein